jgi:hypothetical protein
VPRPGARRAAPDHRTRQIAPLLCGRFLGGGEKCREKRKVQKSASTVPKRPPPPGGGGAGGGGGAAGGGGGGGGPPRVEESGDGDDGCDGDGDGGGGGGGTVETPCGHRYHVRCIVAAVDVGGDSCPVCRRPMLEAFEKQAAAGTAGTAAGG